MLSFFYLIFIIFISHSRSAEFVALVAVSCTLFLFIHTKTLTTRLREMENKLQPSVISASGISANSISQGKKVNLIFLSFFFVYGFMSFVRRFNCWITTVYLWTRSKIIIVYIYTIKEAYYEVSFNWTFFKRLRSRRNKWINKQTQFLSLKEHYRWV